MPSHESSMVHDYRSLSSQPTSNATTNASSYPTAPSVKSTTSSSITKGNCFNCGRPGHHRSQCTQKKQQSYRCVNPNVTVGNCLKCSVKVTSEH